MSSLGDVLKYLGASVHLASAGQKGPDAVPTEPSDAENPEFQGPLATAPMAAPGSPSVANAMAATPDPGNLAESAQASQGAISLGEAQIGQSVGQASQQQDAATDQSLKAAYSELKYKNKLSEAQASTFKNDLSKLDALDSDFANTMKDIEAKKKEAQNQVFNAVENLKNTHIYSWWGQAGTGAKMLAIISQALAGGFQGLTGQSGPTPIDRLIDQDMQGQRLGLEQKSEVAKQSTGLYQTLMAELKDRVLAEGAFRDIAYNSTIQRLKDQAGAMGIDQNNVEYQKLVASVLQRQADNRTQLLEYAGKSKMEAELERAKLPASYSSLWTQQRGQDMDLMGKAAGQKPGMRVANIEGFEQYQKTDPEGARALAKEVMGMAGAKAAVHKVVDSLFTVVGRDKNGQDVIGDNPNLDQRQFDQLINNAVLKIKNMENLGAISEADQELATAVIGAKPGYGAAALRKLTGDSNKKMVERLRAFLKNADDIMAEQVSQIGVPDAEGNFVPLRYTPSK